MTSDIFSSHSTSTVTSRTLSQLSPTDRHHCGSHKFVLARSEVINFTVSGAAPLDPDPLAASSYSAAFLVTNLSPGAGETGDTEYSVQEEHSRAGGRTRLTLTDPHRCEHCH